MPSPDEQAPDEQGLAEVLAEVARVLVSEDDLSSTLDKITELAVGAVDGADHCGITRIEGRKVETPAASDDVPEQVDAIQYDTGQGPCLDAIREHEVFESGDISAEDRWPAFARRAAGETGVRSMLSFRLFVEGDTMGALNLYSREVDAFSDDDRHTGSLFAAHAAVAMANAEEIDNLKRAVETRDVIGTAKGMLMARTDITDEEAFDILRRASQRTNVKLREIAERIVNREPIEAPD